MKPALNVAFLVLFCLGCGDTKPPEDPDSEARQQSLAQLAERLRAGPLPAELLRDPALCHQLSAILATLPDTGLVLAALRELPRCWGDEPQVDAVVPLLQSTDERVQAAALQTAAAARSRGARDERLEETLQLLTKDSRPGVRLAAYESLVLGLGPNRGSATGQVLAEALQDPEVTVVATVLRGLSGRTYALEDRTAVEQACLALLEHSDPGVRGSAAAIVSQLVADSATRELVAQRLSAMLADPHPHVVSQAATGLGRLRHLAALPAVMRLLEDRRADTYSLLGAPRLDRPAETLVFRVSTWQRVDDAALRAIERISAGLQEDPFEYGAVRAERIDADIARQVAQAQLWYEDVAESLDQP